MSFQPTYYAIIPAHVRYCKTIEMAAKLLYGEITALSNQSGYCWAQNEYFAELYGVDVRTVKRWLESLKREKFISITNDKKGFLNDRKIWISEEVKKMFTKGQKCPPERDKNVPPFNTTYEYKEKNTKKRNPEKEKDPSPPITFNAEKRCFEGITLHDIKQWRETYPAINVDKVIKECEGWALSNPRNHYRVSLNTFMRNTSEKHTTPYKEPEKKDLKVSEEDISKNQLMAKGWEKIFSGQGNGLYAIDAKPNEILFLFPNNQSEKVEYELSTDEFLKRCKPSLKKLKLI